MTLLCVLLIAQISGGGKPPPPPPSDSGGQQDSVTTGDTIYLPMTPAVIAASQKAFSDAQKISLQIIAKGIPALPVDLPTGALSPTRTQPMEIRMTHRGIGICAYFAYADDGNAQNAVLTALSYCPDDTLQVYVYPRTGNHLVLHAELDRWRVYEPYGVYTTVGNPQFLQIFKITKLPALVIQDTLRGVAYVYEGYLK